MSGTVTGGRKAAVTNLKLHGKDFYSRIGRIGGCNGRGPGYKGGFASAEIGADGLTGQERARKYGAIGGRVSRRGKAKKNIEE